MQTMKHVGWILVGAAVGILVACSGSSSADTGLTQSQVQTMISAAVTPLQQQIAALQSQVQTLQASSAASQAQIFIKAPNAGAAIAASIRQTRGRVTYAASAGTSSTLPSPCNWTLTGRPTTSDALNSSIFSGVSCTGYLFDISGAPTANDQGYIQRLPGSSQPIGVVMLFDGQNCTGNMYISPNVSNIGVGVFVNGAVFTFVQNGSDADAGDPTSAYYMIPANEAPVAGVAIQSEFGEYGYPKCTAATAAEGWSFYPVEPNDPSVTGIPSAPIPGPVLISN